MAKGKVIADPLAALADATLSLDQSATAGHRQDLKEWCFELGRTWNKRDKPDKSTRRLHSKLFRRIAGLGLKDRLAAALADQGSKEAGGPGVAYAGGFQRMYRAAKLWTVAAGADHSAIPEAGEVAGKILLLMEQGSETEIENGNQKHSERLTALGVTKGRKIGKRKERTTAQRSYAFLHSLAKKVREAGTKETKVGDSPLPPFNATEMFSAILAGTPETHVVALWRATGPQDATRTAIENAAPTGAAVNPEPTVETVVQEAATV